MPPFQPDNWGERARIGLFIVSSEAVPEAEWWAMAPPGVSIHAARIASPTPWAAWAEDRSHTTLSPDLARGCEHFAAMRLQAVVLAHTSSSLAGGDGWDEAAIAAMRAALPNTPLVTTNGTDTAAALKAAGSARPFVVLPAWFGEAMIPKATAYYAAKGFTPAGVMRYDPGPDWRDVPPSEMYPKGLGFAQHVAPLYEQILAQCPKGADAVFIAGTGFRCVSIIQALEEALARPVVTANQASLWRCLRAAGIQEPIEGYGQLLRA